DFKHEVVFPHLTDTVLDTIEKWKDDPFFIYYALPAPHTPILPTEEYRGKTGLNEYGDFVYMCDAMVGKIMDTLDEQGLADNTIYHFRGHKADIYEGGHRIPLLIRWPNYIDANMVSDEPVCLTDLIATLADIVELPLPDNAGEDSVSNLPLWKNEKLHQPLRE